MSFGRGVVVVSGASRGIGAEICVQLASRLTEGSTMIGIARSADKLAETKAAVSEKGVQFVPLVMNLAKLEIGAFDSALKDAISQTAARGPIESAILVHNAASMGELKNMRELTDFAAISSYFDFNVCSLYPMNASFIFQVRLQDQPINTKIINMSSLSGIKEMQTYGLYCTGKAAREMIFKVLALEEPGIKVLNYSPGPVDTEMLALAMTAPNEEMQKGFKEMVESKIILTCPQTVSKLMALLESGDYESGAHIDYFDRP